jgi:hypothetical protein
MATAAKQTIDWREYNKRRAQIAVRIDRDDKEALDTVLRRRGESITELLTAYLRPIITEGSPEGQRAHEIISAAVQASIAWNSRHAHGFGDTEPVRDQDGYPARDTWRRSDIVVSPRTTKGGQTVNYHTVVQREGESRSDAIRRYADLLICAWADTPEDLRDGLLSEIGDEDQHRFIIGYDRFGEWASFPDGGHEMQMHYERMQEPHVLTAQDADEAAFITWARDYLRSAWRTAGKARNGTLTIANPGGWEDVQGIPQTYRHYAHRSDADNIESWAGLWLTQYRRDRAGLTHEQAIDHLRMMQIRIRLMTFNEA